MVLSQASPTAADPGPGSERAPRRCAEESSQAALPGAWSLPRALPSASLLLPQMAVVVTHPFIPSSLHSFTVRTPFFQVSRCCTGAGSQGLIPMTTSWKKRRPRLQGAASLCQHKARPLAQLPQLQDPSSMGSLIALPDSVPYKTRLIGNQQSVSPGVQKS